VKLSQLTAAMVRSFMDKLHNGTPAPGQGQAQPRSEALTRKIISSLGSILADAQERGQVGQNVVRSLSSRRRSVAGKAERRQRGKLRVGVDIPTPAEIRLIIDHAPQRWRALLLTAAFTWLRSSELRGLRWEDVDLVKHKLHVANRVDRYGQMGDPKSGSGKRTIPIGPYVVNALKPLKVKSGGKGLVFANGKGNAESHANVINRALVPAQLAAGVVDKAGQAKYTGLHSLRHFFASWCCNRRVDGGRELPLKVVQELMGHSSIQMTADRYSHLFPSGDDGAELAAAERALMG
jgi:integrase